MSTFEELKTLKIKDANLSQDDFYNVMRERLVEQTETDEVLEKGFDYDIDRMFEEKLAEAINTIYDSPTYFKRATIQLAFNQALKDARSISKQIEYELSLVVVDEFVGCFVGGQDWTGLQDKNGTPMKQDLIFLAKESNDEGEPEVSFRIADIFGKTPVRDWDEELEVGSWYSVGMIEKEGKNKKKYINVGTFEKVSSEGLPTLTELLNEAAISIFDVEEADAIDYRYMVVKGQIRNIAPVPVWDDDMTKPVIHLQDREGKLLYDDEGNKEMGYPQAIVGYENLKDKKLSGEGEAHAIYIRLQDDGYELDDEETDVFFEARFHNQYHGVNTVNLDFDDFLDDDDEEGIDSDPEQLATLISDYKQNTEILAVVKMTAYNPDKNNDKLTWERANGIYIEEA